MKAVCVVVMLLLLAPMVRAQSTETQAPLRIDALTLDRAYRRARTKRNIGIALAVPGVASTLLSVVLLAYGANQEPNINSEVGELVGGGITLALGLAIGIPGVVLWTTGQDDMDVVKWRRQQLAPFVSIRPGAGSAGFTFRF